MNMARFRGTVGTASRLGHRDLNVTANGWSGGVSVWLGISEDGKDTATVWLTTGSSHQGGKWLLWSGPIENMDTALVEAGKQHA